MFDFLRRKKRIKNQEELDEELRSRSGYAPLVLEEDPDLLKRRQAQMAAARKHTAVERCGELIEAVSTLEDLRNEYKLVTNYLNDIQKLENMDAEVLSPIVECAREIGKLDTARNKFLNKEHKISDMQFAQFQEEEADMPGIIRRFQSNEAYLAALTKDLSLLEREKKDWDMVKSDEIHEQKALRRISYVVLVLAGTIVLLFMLMNFLLEMEMGVYMMLAAFLAVAFASYVILKYQDSNRQIVKADKAKNQAIELENHVKIKYVGIKNAVDYTCAKYKVESAAQLLYNFEQYQEMVKERAKFRQTSDDLAYYSERLVRLLEMQFMYDARIWLHYISALMDPKEMVELKHNMLLRRQKVREQIDDQKKVMSELRDEIEGYVFEAGADMSQVALVLAKIDALQAQGI